MLGENSATTRPQWRSTKFPKPFTSNGFGRNSYHSQKNGTAIGYTVAYKSIPHMTRQLNKMDFTKNVIESGMLSLVQFTKQWNGASQIIAPVYNELSASYNGVVNFFTVDVEMEQGLDSEYGVRDIPTILFFKKGKVIDHAIGLTPKNVLISKIENAMAAAGN